MSDAFESLVKVFRERRGWSQLELAAESGLSRSEVSAIETGRLVPSTAAALRLAQAFGCHVEDIFRLGETAGRVSALFAWEPRRDLSARYWQAEVAGVEWRYPAEDLPTGGLMTDEGALRRGISHETLVLAACDPAVGLLTRKLEQLGIRCLAFARSSRAALRLLAEGKVHVAGIHLGASSEENGRLASEAIAGRFSLAHVAAWEEGIASSPATGKIGTGARDLRRRRWVGREAGSGARRCSDKLLENPKRAPEGYDRLARDHRGVAEAIRSGWAEVGVCVRLAAEEAGLNFNCVAHEAYDLCFLDRDVEDPRLQALLRCLRAADYRSALGSLPGYDSHHCGENASFSGAVSC